MICCREKRRLSKSIVAWTHIVSKSMSVDLKLIVLRCIDSTKALNSITTLRLSSSIRTHARGPTKETPFVSLYFSPDRPFHNSVAQRSGPKIADLRFLKLQSCERGGRAFSLSKIKPQTDERIFRAPVFFLNIFLFLSFFPCPCVYGTKEKRGE